MTAVRASFVPVAILAAALGVVATAPPASATAPAPPPRCGPSSLQEFHGELPGIISSAAALVRTIEVTGAGPYLQDLDVLTEIEHDFSSDLDVTLQSPAGTVVTLTTDNGADVRDVFDFTFWDDDLDPGGQVPYTSSDHLVTDTQFVTGGQTLGLTPEEALGAFVGEDPNGTWTLTITDDFFLDDGQLEGWDLTITSGPVPRTRSTSHSNGSDVAIPDTVATVSSSITVSGARRYLQDVDVETSIPHPAPGTLQATVQSPEGTIVTLTTGNGGEVADAFDGTTWDDDANPGGQLPYTSNDGLVTDHAYVAGNVATPLAPEEPLAAFIGEDPNGVWTLTVADDTAGGSGMIDGWSLDLTTSGCSRPDGRIRLGRGALVGNGVYNQTGVNQTRTGRANPGQSVTYTVGAQNDSVFNERLRIKGGGSTGRFRVTYRNEANADITAQVTGAGFRTPVLVPGRSYAVKVIVTVRATAPRGASLTRLVRVQSTASSRVDVVRAITQRR